MSLKFLRILGDWDRQWQEKSWGMLYRLLGIPEMPKGAIGLFFISLRPIKEAYERHPVGYLVYGKFDDKWPRSNKEGRQVRIIECGKAFREIGLDDNTGQCLFEQLQLGAREPLFQFGDAAQKRRGKDRLSHRATSRVPWSAPALPVA